ncbi:helix-turn-helix domain-containing protein [Sneathiella sp. P13V-1]|uniref:AraC family transcriptional regulator n=1 Tax=Sneathiella sp. P13V-1 TaxID=2697366 RepID=UPI00187B6E06|nr:AraC family transcriptional regulator [Sneathiella sp. P13V-1]MBE7636730.1 helix-turn-helix domain-containing protein [Sneathiella sp. P13V-1]
MRKANVQRYEQRLQRVTDYIYENLDQDIDLLHLADIACMSPYHWHRIYQAVHGETITATVRRLRLAKAAHLLTNTSRNIAEIVESCGFQNTQYFTRVFKKHYGVPPAHYRKSGPHARFDKPFNQLEEDMFEVSVVDHPKSRIAAVPHIGPYINIGAAFDKMYGSLDPSTIDWSLSRSVGVYLDDPDTTSESELRSFAGVTVGYDFKIKAPLEEIELPASRYAVLHYKGPYTDMRKAYGWLFEEWLMDTDEEPANAPCFEDYLNSPRETSPTELLTDIYLPLAAKT